MIDIAGGFMSAVSAALNLDGGHPRDPAIAKMLGMGTKNSAKQDVTHHSVMGLPAVMRAVNIVSNGVAKMPYYVFREEDEARTWDRDHPAWYPLAVKPNSEFTCHTFIRTMTAWAMTYGNAVAYIHSKNWPLGGDVEFVPLLPDRTRPMRIGPGFAQRYDIAEDIVGSLFYETRIGGDVHAYAADRCIHIRNLGPNPYWGYDIVETLAEVFGGAMGAQEFGGRFWGQGANPAGFIEMPAGLDEEAEQRFVESIRRGSEGMNKAHRLMLLEEGAKFHKWTTDPKTAQFLEGKQFDIRLLAMALGVKVHKLVDSANSSFNSLEQANQEHKDDDLIPWVRAWEGELSDKLLTDDERRNGTHSIGVDDEQMEWVPFGERSRGVVELYNNGLIDKDEGRRKVNFGPSKSPDARRYRKPANIGFEDEKLVAVPQAQGQQNDPGDDDSEARESLAELQADYLDRVATRLSKEAMTKAGKTDGGKDFVAWVDGLKPHSAPKSVEVEVARMHQCLQERLAVVVDTTAADGLLAATGAALEDWKTEHTNGAIA